jgi:tetratricopeptide (TPR) repeat protein
MRTAILIVATLLALPPALAAQVPQVPRGNAINPDMERAKRHYDLGWGLFRSEDWAGAVKEFQQVIDIDPRFANAYYSLGRAEMGLRHFQKAIDAYTKCREVYLASGGETFSNQLNGTRRIEDRIFELTTARAQAQTAGAKTNTQSQQLYISELTNNIRELEQVRDRNQNVTIDTSVPFFVPLALGAAYFRSGKLEDAEREYKTAIEANSASGETHNNLAVLYMTTGRLEEATSEVKLAEKTGFRVNPQFKQDLEARRQGKF